MVQHIVAHRRTWKNDKSHEPGDASVDETASDTLGNSDKIILMRSDHTDMDSFDDNYGQRKGVDTKRAAVPLVRLEGFDA